MNFYIIGIDDNSKPNFPADVTEKITRGYVFSGGDRHYKIVKSYLPKHHVWIEIRSPLTPVLEQYKQYTDIIIFASGDPLFYGFAGTLKRQLIAPVIEVYPYFNSLQLLAHRMVLPYEDMQMVSLTGRPWHEFDRILIEGHAKIGVLTDQKKTPAEIVLRMLKYGYNNYRITVGEMLGNRDYEQVRTLSLEAAVKEVFEAPNCLVLERETERLHPFGIPEAHFEPLHGRTNMITKLPIRLLTLSMLDLRNRKSFWDIGFCTGSVSIEAKLQFPRLRITSFEVREEGARLIERNSELLGAPGIESVIGDFLKQDLTILPVPDAVFIGGHGGCLDQMVCKVNSILKPGGVLVFNSVSTQSLEQFTSAVESVGMKLEQQTRISIDDFNTITILKAIQL